MRCDIMAHAVVDGPLGPNTPMRAVYACRTHGMPVASIHLPGHELCPIGKIEVATEAALAKIAAATPPPPSA